MSSHDSRLNPHQQGINKQHAFKRDIVAQAAQNAIESLDRNCLCELKTFVLPPAPVMAVVESVCVLLGEQPTWASGRMLLSDPHLLLRLMAYDIDHIDPDKLAIVRQQYIGLDYFNPDSMYRVSRAAADLCRWVLAVDTYDRRIKDASCKSAVGTSDAISKLETAESSSITAVAAAS